MRLWYEPKKQIERSLNDVAEGMDKAENAIDGNGHGNHHGDDVGNGRVHWIGVNV